MSKIGLIVVMSLTQLLFISGSAHATNDPLKVWLVTWNTENQAPTAEHIQALFKDVSAGKPDIIALGLQESIAPEPTELLKSITGYQAVKTGRMNGITKIKEGFNFQYLGIFARSDIAKEVQDVQLLTSSQSGIKSIAGKGAIIIQFKLRGKAYAFATAHLPTSDNPKLVQQIMKDIAGTPDDVNSIKSALVQKYSAVFLMGDLNYRLKTSDMGNQASTGGLVLKLLSDRQKVLNMDSLKDSSLRTTFDFSFPTPNFLPTYKLYDAQACQSVAATPTAANVQKCYFPSGKTEVKEGEKREGFTELGWLDRVGYVERPYIKVLEFKSFPNIVVSDHLPVILKVSIDATEQRTRGGGQTPPPPKVQDDPNAQRPRTNAQLKTIIPKKK